MSVALINLSMILQSSLVLFWLIPWKISKKEGKHQPTSKEWPVWCKVMCEHQEDAVNWFVSAPKCEQVWWSVKKYVTWRWQSCHTEGTLTIRGNDSSTTLHLPVQTPVPKHPIWATSGTLGHVQTGMSHLKAHLSKGVICDYSETWRCFFLEERHHLLPVVRKGQRSFLGVGLF